MTSVALTIAILLAAGVPLAVLLSSSRSVPLLSGKTILLGFGAGPLLLLVATTAGAEWSRAVALLSLALAAGLLLPALRRARTLPAEGIGPAEPRATIVVRIAADASVLLLLAGYVGYVMLATPWEWDFWAIWGAKGRIWFEHGGIDWDFLRSTYYAWQHPAYPPLMPLTFDLSALVEGSWNDRWLGLFFPFYGAGLLLVLRGFVAETTASRVFASLVTLAAAGSAFPRWIGMPEAPLIAFISAGALLYVRGLEQSSRREALAGALLLGFGALMKDEGLAFSIAAVVAAAIIYRERLRDASMILVAPLLGALWQVQRIAHGIAPDLTAGGASPAERLIHNLSNPAPVLEAFAAQQPDQPLFWIAATALIAAGARRFARGHRFLLLVLAIHAAFVLTTYLAGGYDAAWRVRSSWPRIVDQMRVLIVVLAAASAWETFRLRAIFGRE